jgi:hypothetical protein
LICWITKPLRSFFDNSFFVVVGKQQMEVMRAGDVDLGYLTAALAVANLGQCRDHSQLTTGNRNFFEELTEAFRVTLAGSAYPVHSGNYYTAWKMCISLANLSRIPLNRAALRETGITPLLINALDKDDTKLSLHALHVLWNLHLDHL